MDWAGTRLNEAQTAIDAFLATEPYHLVRKHDGATGEESLHVCVVRPVPEDLVFRIGAALHEMRVALDYLAFAIARRNAPAYVAAHPKAPEFPMCEKLDGWPSYEGKLVKWANPDAVIAFRALQPFVPLPKPRTRFEQPQPHPLLLLDKLENPHKHRELLAAGSAVSTNAFTLNEGSINMRIIKQVAGPFENDMELIRYKLMGPLHPQTKAQIKVIFGVAFAKEGPAPGAEVNGLLKRIHDHIRDVVFPALKDYV